MRKLFIIFVALFASTTLWAQRFQSGDLYYNVTSDSTVEVTYQHSESELNYSELTEVVIPENVINNNITYKVTCVGENAFYYSSSITKVEMANSIISIGESAFYGCISLENIMLSQHLETIATNAFYNCRALAIIEIPHSVIHIESGAFYSTKLYNNNANWQNNVLYIGDCLIVSNTSLSGDYVIKDGTRLIADRGFYNKYNLSSITIPNSVMYIGNEAFYKCKKLTSITLPENVTAIGNSAFSGCSALAAINIPENVTTIGKNAFSGCKLISSIALPKSLTTIGAKAFYGCESITSIVIPENTESIGESAFENCISLTSLDWNAKNCRTGGILFNGASISAFAIGDSVESIPEYLCAGFHISSLTIPENIKKIAYYAFVYCKSLTSVVWNAKDCELLDQVTFQDSPISSIILGESVEHVPAYLCYNMDKLTTITIPENVISVGQKAFTTCSALTSVIWNAKQCTDFREQPFPLTLTSFTIGDSVQHIPAYLCYKQSNLTSFSLPKSVKSIGSSAFFGCTSLNSIHGNLDSIGDYAFYDCTSLNSIKGEVTYIGNYAFYGCTSLSSISLAEALTFIGNEAFTNCSSLDTIVWNVKSFATDGWNLPFKNICTQIKSFTFGDSVEEIPYHICYGMSSLATVSLGESITSIADEAFYGCSSLTTIELPNHLTTIGKGVFNGCSSLISVKLSDSLTAIGSHAFTGCSSLTAVDLPNSLVTLGGSAFSDCFSLSSISIPCNVTSVGGYVFKNCTSLTSLVWNAKRGTDYTWTDASAVPFADTNISSFVFGDSVEYIPARLCTRMSKLTSITIPENITSIGDEAFYKSALDTVIWEAKNCTIGTSVFKDLKISTFILGDKMEYIPASLCSGMNVTSVVIPSSVIGVGNNPFPNLISVFIKATSVDDYFQRKINQLLYNSGVKNAMRTLLINEENAKEIIVPQNIDSVGDYIFYKCSELTSITLHENVKYIGDCSLFGCSSLDFLTLPYNIEGIQNSYASNCDSVIFIIAPSVEEYCQNDLNNQLYQSGEANAIRKILIDGVAVHEVVFPDTTTIITENLFYNCLSLTSITIPNSVTSIEKRAFYGCEALKTIYLNAMTPPAIPSYDVFTSQPICYIPNGTLATYENSNWAKQVSKFIEAPANGYQIQYISSDGNIVEPSAKFKENIVSNVYENNQGTITFSMPFSTIIAEAFLNCSTLTSVTIPDFIERIDDRAFANCYALGVVEVKTATPPAIGTEVFTSAPICYIRCGIETLYKNSEWANQISEFVEEKCSGNQIFYTTLDEKIISLSEESDFGANLITNEYISGQGIMTFDAPISKIVSFANCTTLTSITIPESVIQLVASAFKGCTALTSIVWHAKRVEQVKWGGGSMLGAPLPRYDVFEGVRSQITSFVFGESVEYIPEFICEEMNNITSIIIPDNVTEICGGAFYGCTALQSVIMSNQITTLPCAVYSYSGDWMDNRYYGVFGECTSLTSITLSNNLQSVGRYTFDNCSSLPAITLPNVLKSIDYGAFNNCSSLSSIMIPNSVTHIGNGAFRYCSLTSITIPENLQRIGNGAFASCISLDTIYWNAVDCINEDDTSPIIESCPFARCGVKTIFVGDNVLSIPTRLFANSPALTTIEFPRYLYEIGASAFENCSSLDNIVIPEYVWAIGEDAFKGCTSLKSIVWNPIEYVDPKNSSEAPFNAISSQITNFSFGEKVEHIPSQLCSNMTKLTSITIPNNVKTIGSSAFMNCTGLTQVNYTGDVTDWCQMNFTYINENPNYYAKNLYINGDKVIDLVIPKSVKTINPYTFYGCTELSSLVIPESVTSIGADAFGECRKLYDIYSYAKNPPVAEENSFANYNVYLHVPCDNLRDYQMDMVFGSFKYIQCIESEEVTTDDGVTVVPGYNDVTITWPTAENADSYSLVINKDNQPFCTLTFNQDGQLLNIAFAPSRDGNNRPAQYAEQAVNGYRFTVTGLTEATQYAYNITTKDAANNTIATYSGEFTTMGGTTTAVEDILQNTTNVQKLLRNGNLVIIRDGVEYNAMGQEL